MSRPRKPTKILELSGARKSRLRQRADEPQPTGPIGEPPEHLLEPEADAWREIAGILPDGVAGMSDRIALERLARLIHMARSQPADWTSAREKDLASYLSRFGMTPGDRGKLRIPNQGSTSPWDDL